MTVERCDECGFDGGSWSDDAAVEAIGELLGMWVSALAGFPADQLLDRPVAEMWSIAEYADHVREVPFGMRLALDSAVGQPGYRSR